MLVAFGLEKDYGKQSYGRIYRYSASFPIEGGPRLKSGDDRIRNRGVMAHLFRKNHNYTDLWDRGSA